MSAHPGLMRRMACAAGFHRLVYVARGWRVCSSFHADLRIGEVERNGHRAAQWFEVGKLETVGTPDEIATAIAAIAKATGSQP